MIIRSSFFIYVDFKSASLNKSDAGDVTAKQSVSFLGDRDFAIGARSASAGDKPLPTVTNHYHLSKRLLNTKLSRIAITITLVNCLVLF